jgi:hypothetical protein
MADPTRRPLVAGNWKMNGLKASAAELGHTIIFAKPSNGAPKPEGFPQPGSIERDHLANAKAEVVPMRLRKEVDLMHAEIHGARRNLMQQRLP